jgi:hypothetical protein
MIEVQIYDDIANKSEQVWMSAWGMDNCVFSADVAKRVLRDNPDEQEIKFNIHCNGGSVEKSEKKPPRSWRKVPP